MKNENAKKNTQVFGFTGRGLKSAKKKPFCGLQLPSAEAALAALLVMCLPPREVESWSADLGRKPRGEEVANNIKFNLLGGGFGQDYSLDSA